MGLISLVLWLLMIAAMVWAFVCLFRKGRRWRGVILFLLTGTLYQAVENSETVALAASMLLLIISLIWGVVWLFRAGRRRWGGLMLMSSLILLVSSFALESVISEHRAQERGFLNLSDQKWAEAEGYQSSYEWSFVRDHFQTLERTNAALSDDASTLTPDEISALEAEAELATQAIAAREEIRQERLAAQRAREAERAAEAAAKRAEERRAELEDAARSQAIEEALRAAELEEERELAAAQEAAEADDRRRGFHCLSQWDGSHRELARSVIDSLNDPRSFQHVDTLTTNMREDGTNGILMKFRARNGFGALVLNHVQATMRNSDCAILEWTLQ